jgi:hypothetical protein
MRKSLSIISPSLMVEEMVVLTQIGNGATFTRWSRNTEALPQDRPIVRKFFCLSLFHIPTSIVCFLPSYFRHGLVQT